MLKVKSQKFMFFDDWPLESSKGFTRKQGKPVRYESNPVLKPDLPHEGSRASLYGTILHDEEADIYKMWYPAFSLVPKGQHEIHISTQKSKRFCNITVVLF